MSEPITEAGMDEPTSGTPAEAIAVTGSVADVPESQEPVLGSQEPVLGSQEPVPESQEPAAAVQGSVSAVVDSAGSGGPSRDPAAVTATSAKQPASDLADTEPAGARQETARAAGDQTEPQAQLSVPQLVKVLHSARSVFRQRDVKEYDPFTAHLERRITKLFEALDTEQTGRVDVHELGTLIRSVGCCPSETELQEMVTQLEEEGQPGFIRLATVMPYIIQCVEDRKYPSASSGQLLQAFQVLADDCAAQEEARTGPKREKKEEERDTLPQDKLVHILTEEGEHFSQEEVEEMLSVVPVSDSARVQYTEFVKQLVVPELW